MKQLISTFRLGYSFHSGPCKCWELKMLTQIKTKVNLYFTNLSRLNEKKKFF